MSTINNPRAVALQTLMKVLNNQSYSNISLNNSFKHAKLSPADQKLATRLVYGTIQYKIYLEYQLKDLLRVKITEKYVMPLLLMSAYQMLFLDKIPNRAAIDEANKLAKEFGKHHSSGYRVINGILRSLDRRGPILPDKSNLTEYLSIKESIPNWLVKYFIDNWGEKRARKIMASINQPAKNSIRISSKANYRQVVSQLKKMGYNPQESNLANNVVILDHGAVAQTPLFKNGQITMQDEAASLVADCFTYKSDDQILDACSAPGGKTVQMAENLSSGCVTALDIHEKKLRLVMQNAKRMNVDKQVKVKALDARKANEYFSKEQFDKILVDAPCSGLGLLRRKPEIRYTKQEQDLLNLQKIQLAILDKVSTLLNKSGELIYSTCTISVEEDEEVVKKFLASHPQFELIAFKLAKISSKTGMLKILPDSYGSDGFFIAKFKMRG